MTRSYARTFTVLAIAAAALAVANVASAQDRQPTIFDRLFGSNERESRSDDPPRVARNSPADLTVRIDRLEAQIRQLTGVIEQLQYRNQQLEAQLQRLQGANGPQTQNQAQTPGPGAPLMRVPPPGSLSPAPPTVPGQTPPTVTGRRNDAFDPSQNPNAPGAPRTLGTLSGIPPTQADQSSVGDTNVGAPGGRLPGAPLDLTTMGTNQANNNQANVPGNVPANNPGNNPASAESNVLPPPPARNLSSTGVVASTLPPSASPRDQFDLGVGYIQRKDYALAEDALQTFLTKYPTDKLAADAQFWLGEARFQRQRYDAAAESFLAVSTKHTANAKAPDAMLRLGQSLAALGQREMACATLAELPRKFPRASANVRQGVEREQKRVHC